MARRESLLVLLPLLSELRQPGGGRAAERPALQGLPQLLRGHSRVSDHAELHLRGAVHLLRSDVDLRYPNSFGIARPPAKAEDPVEASSDHHDRVGALQGGGACGIHEVRAVVWDHAPTHGRRDVRNPQVHEALQGRASIGPRAALAEHHQGPLRTRQQVRDALDRVRIWMGRSHLGPRQAEPGLPIGDPV